MARGRMISNGIAHDKRIHQLSDDTSRLAYTWLVTFADCEGRTPGDAAVVRSMLFPRREDITISQMEGYIKQWHDLGLVIWYFAKDDMWIYFPAFFSHNKINRERESISKIPAPPPELVMSNSGVTPEECTLNLNQVKLNQSNSNQINGGDGDINDQSPIYLLYTDTFGKPLPMMEKILMEVAIKYPPDKIEDAFKIAGQNGAKSFAYVRAILEDKKHAKPKFIDRVSAEARSQYGER